MPRQSLTEAGTVTPVTEAGKAPRLQVQLITPGWGASGYYSAKVLEAAAEAGAWPAGTQMFLDHPTQLEDEQRPGRSVKDLAAVLTETARWNGSAVVAEAEPAGPGRAYASDKAFVDAVGVSIRSSAEVELGEAEGRRGWIVREIFPDTGNSVDFVTHAGRGGRILQLIESARAAEAGELDSDRREKFRNAVRDAYADDKVEVWVQDYDDTVVYWERWGGDNPGTFSQTYKETDDAVELTGDPVKVRTKTTYVPVDEAEKLPRSVDLTREAALATLREARNVGQWMESRIHLGFTQVADEMFGNGKLTREERIALSSGIGAALDAFVAAVEKSAPQLYSRDLWTDPEALAVAAEAATTPNVPVDPAGPTTTEEQTMPQIEEERLKVLEEAHGRVPALEAESKAATERAEAAERELAVEKAKSYAREFGTKRVRESNSELAGPVVEEIVRDAMQVIPLGEDQRLDTIAFGEQVDKAQKAEETYLASIAENVGHVRGLGSAGDKPTVTEAQVSAQIADTFGLTQKGA